MYTFDLTKLSPSNAPLVASYSTLADEELKALLSYGQAVGAYSLAGGAAGFADGVQICLDSGICIGLLRLYDGFCFDGFCYTLELSGDELQLIVSSDTTILESGVTVGSGTTMQVSSGTALLNAVVSPDGAIEVFAGGAVSSAIVSSGGTMIVLDGGVAEATTLESGASMVLDGGAHLNGAIDAGGTVTTDGTIDAYGTTFTFNVTNRTTEDGYILNDLAAVEGAEFAVIVGSEQAVGTYSLAGNAAKFDGTVTVYGENGSRYVELTVGSAACYGNYCYTVDVDNEGILSLDISVSETKRTEAMLPYTMPQAEYMYGCTPTALAMLLGYYDKYGYLGYDVSDLIAGDISIYSRGTDGDAYNMNAFDTVLGNFIATQNYVDMFVGKTPAEELPYAFDKSGNVNTSVYDCLAGWLGTGQYWRGVSDLATFQRNGTLDSVLSSTATFTVTSGGESHTLPIRYKDFKAGLSEYLATVGYQLDGQATRSWTVDVNGGGFTFEDYMAEIDAGRAVLISIDSESGNGHMMVGYGYDSLTHEIIFDDTYQANQRMTWGSTYTYSDDVYTLSSIHTVVFDTAGLSKKSTGFSQIGTWGTSLEAAKAYAKEHSIPIFLYFGDRATCGFCRLLEDQVFASDDFLEYVNSGSMVMLKNVSGFSYSGTPTCILIDADGNEINRRVGFGSGTKAAWMDWFDDYVSLIDRSGYTVDLAVSDLTLSAAGNDTGGLEITDFDSILLNAVVVNNGMTAIGEAQAGIYIDGAFFRSYMLPGLSSGERYRLNSVSLGRLDIGKHTIELRLDDEGYWEESNEANNVFSQDINVLPGTQGRTIVSSGISVVMSSALSNAYVLEEGTLVVLNSGVVEKARVMGGGILEVSSGGLANSAYVSAGGVVNLHDSGEANVVRISAGGSLMMSSGAVLNELTIQRVGSAVMKGGSLQGANIYGALNISSGSAEDLWLYAGGGFTNGGSLTIGKDAVVSGVKALASNTLYAQIRIYVSGSVTDMTMHGRFYDEVQAACNPSYAYVWGWASSLSIAASDVLYVKGGGVVQDVFLGDNGYLEVSAGGVARDVVQSGFIGKYPYTDDKHAPIKVLSGGVLQDAVVTNVTYMSLQSGAVLSGKQVWAGREVHVSGNVNASDAQIAFNLPEWTVESGSALVRNISGLKDGSFAIMASRSGLKDGVYMLANDATAIPDVLRTLTVVDTFWRTLGSVSVGTVAEIGVYDLTLTVANKTLSLTVTTDLTNDKVAPVLTGNVNATVSGYNVSLSWNEATDDTLVDYYDVQIGSQTYSADSNSMELELRDGVYDVRVRAVDAAGKYSDWATAPSVTVSVLDTEAPTFTKAPATTVVGNRVTWNWNASDNVAIDHYVMTVGGESFVLDGAASQYSYRLAGKQAWTLSAVDFAGNSTVKNGSVSASIPMDAVQLFQGEQICSEGASMENIIMEDGTNATSLTVSLGGRVSHLTMKTYGYLYVFSGGIVSDIQLNSGYIRLNSGGVIQNGCINKGTIYLRGGLLSGTTQTGDYIYISSGGVTSDTTQTGGNFYVSTGGIAIGATVTGGFTVIQSGGVASSMIVTDKGYASIRGSGVLKDVTISNGGSLYLSSGAILCGTLSLGEGAYLQVLPDVEMQEVEVHLDVSSLYTFTVANLSNLGGAVLNVTTLAGRAGKYCLATGVTSYTGTVTVRQNGEAIGMVAIGESFQKGTATYSLTMENRSLYLNVRDPKAAPLITVKAIQTVPTVKPVTVTATVMDDTEVELLYSLDGKKYVAYTNGVTLSANGTVYFKATDTDKNVSTTKYTIANILSPEMLAQDHEAPVFTSRPQVIVGGSNATLTWAATDNLAVERVVLTAGWYEMEFEANVQSHTFFLYGDHDWTLTAYDFAGNHVTASGRLQLPIRTDVVRLNSAGVTVSSASAMDSVVLGSGMNLSVFYGGQVNRTQVGASGYLVVYLGGIASRTVQSGGTVGISSDGIAVETVQSGGYFSIQSGIVSGMTQYGGSTYLWSGGRLKEMVQYGGSTYVCSSSIASDVIQSGGIVQVNKDGILKDAVVSSGGLLFLASGAVLRGTLALESGAMLSATSGIDAYEAEIHLKLSSLYSISDLSMLQGIVICVTTLAGRAGKYLLADGAASYNGTVTIRQDEETIGMVTVGGSFQKGTATYSLAVENGSLYLNIRDKTAAPQIFVTASRELPTAKPVTVTATVMDDTEVELLYSLDGNVYETYVDGVTLSANGTVYFKATDMDKNVSTAEYKVSNILTPEEIAADKEAPVFTVAPTVSVSGNYATWTWAATDNLAVEQVVLTIGQRETGFDADVSSHSLYLYGDQNWTMTVYDAAGNSVSAGGSLQMPVPNYAVTLYSSGVIVSSASSMDSVALGSGMNMYAYYGGHANRTRVGASSYMNVYSGGIASGTVQSSGTLSISSDGLAVETVKSGGYFAIYNDGLAIGMTQHGGSTYVNKGGIVSDVTQNGGSTYVDSGGIASDVTQNGGIVCVSNGGILKDAAVSSGGSLFLSRGAVLRGSLALERGAVVSMTAPVDAHDAEIHLKLSSLYTISNLSLFQGVSLSVTVAENQAFGLYTLVNGAEDFEGTVTVCLESGLCLEAMDVGESRRHEGTAYSVSLDGGTLNLLLRNAAVAPVINVTPSTTNPTNQPVVLTAVATDDTGGVQLLYSLNNNDYTAYTGAITVTDNKTVHFKAVDMDGNETVVSCTVSNIDKVSPVISSIRADVTTLTNGMVTVTASANDDANAVSLYYSKDDGEFMAYYDGVRFTANGNVVFKAVDAAGNETQSERFDVTNIDTTAPVITLTGDNTTPRQSATLTASTEAGVDIYWSTNNATWKKYEGALEVTENRRYYFKATDAAGNRGTAQITFTNIDKVAPVITLTADNVTPQKSTQLAASTEAGVDVFWSTDTVVWKKYSVPLNVTANGTWYFKATDAAGNKGTAQITFANIDRVAPTIFDIQADVTTLTNGTVTVTASASDDANDVSLFYSKDGGAYVAYDGGVEFTANGKVVLKAVDAAGNQTVSAPFEVTNIDKVAPVIRLTGDNSTPRQSATLTASTEAGIDIYWSPDNKTWTKYEGELEITENGTYYFKATDVAGNKGVNAIKFTNIDTAPPIIELEGDNSTPRQSAKLTASTEAGLKLFYNMTSPDYSGDWTEYTGEISVTTNGTWYFKATDAAGNTGTARIAFANIDTVAPEISDIAADVTAPTNSKVTVTANASDDVNDVALYYSKDGGEFIAYDGGVEFTANGNVVFKAVDAAGNETLSDAFEVTNIDTVPPAIELLADTATPLQSTKLTAATEAGLKLFYNMMSPDYSGDWTEYTGEINVTANGTWYFRATDAAGNTGVAQIAFTNIDTVKPTISDIMADVTAPTNGKIVVTAVASDDANDVTLFYSKDDGEFVAYDGGVEFTENGTVVFKAIDAAGNETVSEAFEVTNIDRIAPVIELTGDTVSSLQSTKLTASTEAGVDIYWSADNANWTKYEGELDVTANGTYYFKATDAAGNTGTAQITFANLDTGAPVITLTGDTTASLQKSTLSAAVDDDVDIYWSTDNETWTKYEGPLDITANGTYYFKATDAAGNVGTNSIIFDNIDTVKPTISDIVADVTSPTNGKIVVTAVASDDANDVTLFYSKDGGEFVAYDGGVEFTENGTVVFKAVDAAGNETVSEVFEVTNIDRIAPIIELTGDTVSSLQSTKLTAITEAGVDIYWSTDNANWTKYEGELNVTANGTYYFKATDAAGNTGTGQITFANLDTGAPVITLTGDTTASLQKSTLSAAVDDDVDIYWSTDNETWTKYEGPLNITANGTYYFKATDEAGNVGTNSIIFNNIDTVKPTISDIAADVTAPTNGKIVVTAVASDDANDVALYYSKDGGEFVAYDNGVEFTANGSVVFKAVDAAGNEMVSEAFEVTNIDTVAPSVSRVDVSQPDEFGTVIITVEATETLSKLEYSWNDGEWLDASGGTVSVAENGSVTFRLTDLAGNGKVTEAYAVDAFNVTMTEIGTAATEDGGAVFNWGADETAAWSEHYDVVIAVEAGSIELPGIVASGIELLNAPSGDVAMAVKPSLSDVWTDTGDVIVDNQAHGTVSQFIEAEENGLADIMFATGSTVWNGNYEAEHVGVGAWDGTGETAVLNGKNAIADVFAGSDDASILLLTDDENGDALFIDDIYSAFPEGFDAQARIAKINEIRAGDGDDIVDLTSQRFDYVGGGMTVHGGLGDDVIWANNGDNTLFGDTGNDRLIGAGGNDVLVGGADNDSMHGGGGEDIFTFGGKWGNDNIEQLADGKVTLWFKEGDESKWDEATLTYQDGDQSVRVSGVTAESITLKFGDDGSEQYGKLLKSGAFDEFSGERVFENKNTRGMLA